MGIRTHVPRYSTRISSGIRGFPVRTSDNSPAHTPHLYRPPALWWWPYKALLRDFSLKNPQNRCIPSHPASPVIQPGPHQMLFAQLKARGSMRWSLVLVATQVLPMFPVLAGISARIIQYSFYIFLPAGHKPAHALQCPLKVLERIRKRSSDIPLRSLQRQSQAPQPPSPAPKAATQTYRSSYQTF